MANGMMNGLTILAGKDAPLMAERTTLRLGGPVIGEVSFTDPAAAAALPDVTKKLGGTLANLGAGSNILAGEGPLALVLVRNAMPTDISVREEDGETSVLRANASVKLPVLLARAAKMDLAGLEGLSGIPGTVGGAVAMNAGSYGQCVADTLTALEIVTGAGEVRRLGRDDIVFAYRSMCLRNMGNMGNMGNTGDMAGMDDWWMITAAEFRLAHDAPGAVMARGRETMGKKKAGQPVTAASAGCVFKNPSPETPAGKLLEAAGYRGKRLGGMVFSPVHANFLVNEGTGTSAEALELMDMAKQAVFARSGVTLETEVKIWA